MQAHSRGSTPTITTGPSASLAMTPALIEEARGWRADCDWRDLEPGEVWELAANVVEAAIARHHVGGVAQFIADADTAWHPEPELPMPAVVQRVVHALNAAARASYRLRDASPYLLRAADLQDIGDVYFGRALALVAEWSA